MKKIFYFILAALMVFSGVTIQAQTLDEILAKHFETIGQDKLLKVQSIIVKGKLIQTQGNVEIPIIMYAKRPNKTRMEGTFQGLTFISAYNGEIGWHLNPFAGDTLPQQSTDEELDQLKDQADMNGMLYNYKEKGFTLELTGTDDLDGQKVYLLKLTKPNGNIYTNYMDAENYVILKTAAKIKVKGVVQEAETSFSNYKPVDGIIEPFNIENKVAGTLASQIILDSFDFNKDIDDSIFEMSSVSKPVKK